VKPLIAVFAVAALAGATTAAAAPAPIRKHSRAGMARARAALVSTAELGKGWTSSGISTRPQTLTCKSSAPSLRGIVETGTASTTFRGASAQGVGQAAWVYGSSEQARSLWTRVVGKGLLRCLIDAARGAGGLTVTRIAGGELELPKIAERSAAYRLIVTAKSGGKTVTLFYDNLLLAAGRTVTQITFGSTRPIPAAVELTLARAVAKKLGTSGAA
jgi:hypothetical protein